MENGARQIYDGIYWVGDGADRKGLNCNPFLLIDGDEAVLIDPGSVLDFSIVLDNVRSLISDDMLKYVVLHHQDPDFCSSTPLFEKEGFRFEIVTHWRAEGLIQYYGVSSDFITLSQFKSSLTLKSGRSLKFLMTPYLHFSGAFVTYDETSGILFSSDIFGAMVDEWSLFAGDDYVEKMKTFHEHYMPSNEILRPVMEMLLEYDIRMIAPQHGSIITGDTRKYIVELRELECGQFLNPIKKRLADEGGCTLMCNRILKRMAGHFGREKTSIVFDSLGASVDWDNLVITDHGFTGMELYHSIYEAMYLSYGVQWLAVMEPFTRTIASEFTMEMPGIYESAIKESEQELSSAVERNMKLEAENARLRKTIDESRKKLERCPVTGLYNSDFFRKYIESDIIGAMESGLEHNPVLVVFSIDNLSRINMEYGESEADMLLKGVAYIVQNRTRSGFMTFRLQGASFAVYIPDSDLKAGSEFAEELRVEIENSRSLIDDITISAGVVELEEIRNFRGYGDSPWEGIIDTASDRLQIAKSMGTNYVCSASSEREGIKSIYSVLIVDTDHVNREVLSAFFERKNYRVLSADDGYEAFEIVERERPDAIITDIMLPKMDAFLLREKLMMNSSTRSIPFFLASNLKDEDSVKRAISLKIAYYFEKPYYLTELIGTVDNIVKGERA